MSRSEAMFAKLLVTSLWQYLFCTPKVVLCTPAKLDLILDCVPRSTFGGLSRLLVAIGVCVKLLEAVLLESKRVVDLDCVRRRSNG